MGIKRVEFRSHRLIPGILANNNFIPDLGGRIIDFKEYQFPASPRRIYNLPGKFLKESEVRQTRELRQKHLLPWIVLR
jgi:hypothetical protein